MVTAVPTAILRRRPCGGWRQTALMLRWLKTVVVSVQGKGAALIASGGDQEDVPEALGRDVLAGVRC